MIKKFTFIGVQLIVGEILVLAVNIVQLTRTGQARGEAHTSNIVSYLPQFIYLIAELILSAKKNLLQIKG